MIQGLTMVRNYITGQEAEYLEGSIEYGYWAERKDYYVQWYGFAYQDNSRVLEASWYMGRLPKWLMPVVERLGEYKFTPDQASAYHIGSNGYMPPRLDSPPSFDDTVMILTLNGPALAVMHNRGDDTFPKDKTFRFQLDPCSLLVLTGPARFFWALEIPKGNYEWKGQKVDRTQFNHYHIALRKTLDPFVAVDDPLIIRERALYNTKVE
jgi:alkylated DNA repair dioxygenase AlkB